MRTVDVNVPRMGSWPDERKQFLNLMTKNKLFDQLDVPCGWVATDQVKGEKQ
jgi:hypothetical protein